MNKIPLSVRAQNALCNVNISIIDGEGNLLPLGMIKQAVQDALFNKERLRPGKLRNYGWKTHKELCVFAGVPIEDRVPGRIFSTCYVAGAISCGSCRHAMIQTQDEEVIYCENPKCKLNGVRFKNPLVLRLVSNTP